MHYSRVKCTCKPAPATMEYTMTSFNNEFISSNTYLSGKEGISCTHILGTSSPSNTMNIILGIIGKVEINHILDISNIYGNHKRHTNEC